MRILGLLLALVSGPVHAVTPRWITPDLFVATDESVSPAEARVTDCRAQIARAICLVDPAADPGAATERPCLPGSQAYAWHFERLYDAFPRPLRRMFCSLRRIHVEKSFFGTAYAGLLTDASGKIVGAQIGIRRSVLDEALSLAHWASWKEQLSWGGVTQDYTLTAGLPLAVSKAPGSVNDFLFFVVAHELGHVFDFANRLNRCTVGEAMGEAECELHPESWGALSWIRTATPRARNEFANRKGLCFYWCKGNPLPASAMQQVYADLHYQTDFLSTYATTQPWDDFADSLAYVLAVDGLGASYRLRTPHGSYDVGAKVRSRRFAGKRAYIRRFLRGPIVYP